MSDIEKKFKKAISESKKEIQSHVKAATKALTEAKKLSEKYGVPFETPVVFLRDYKKHVVSDEKDVYVPASLEKKWGDVRKCDEENDYVDILSNYFEVHYEKFSGMQGNWFPSSLRC